jgi:benzoyl-CoA reductase subunit C
MSRLIEILEKCKEIGEDLSFGEAIRWKAEQPKRKVIGHFQVYFPEEIAHAAGMLPVKIIGGGNRIEARRADAHLGSFICSIMRSTLELGLSGRLQFLDAFVTHPICDAARHLAGIWGRTFPHQPAQILYLSQNPNSKASLRYMASEYLRLMRDIESWTEHPVDTDSLRKSIKIYNEGRALLRKLYEVRKESPWLLSSVELYSILRAGTVLERAVYNQLLRELIPLLAKRKAKPQDKVRVVLVGGFCEMPPVEMIEVMEEMCYIVDDDLLIGMRWLVEDVALDGDPLWNLSQAYLERSAWAPTQYDREKPKEIMLEKMVKDSEAQGAICAAAKFCEPGVDDQLAYAKHLDVKHTPYILVEFEEKQTSFERLKMQVETFAESILFD